MTENNMLIHLVAGGTAGTVGSILTCPLEVIKTRFQSNTNAFEREMRESKQLQKTSKALLKKSSSYPHAYNSAVNTSTANFLLRNTSLTQHKNLMANGITLEAPLNTHQPSRLGTGIYLHYRFIVEREGHRALFKGILPNIVGVAPYRAIYFFSYANAKKQFLKLFGKETSILHICSAGVAGFVAVSITNPIWFIKTRLQLDDSRRGLTISSVVKRIYSKKGILGFYKGVSASYFGICETALYFVIYEKLKSYHLRTSENSSTNAEYFKFMNFFFAAGFSKTLASCLCYPHEVARTRLRQEGNKYNSFFQTLSLVFREEGMRGLYRGMATHLVRQIPNTAIVMTTYELLVKYLA